MVPSRVSPRCASEAFLAAERARNAELGGGLSAAAERFAGSGAKPERSLMMAYLLWFILGQVSAHRFYLGAYRSAMAQVGLFAFVLICAVGNAVGPLVAVALVAWALWVLGDVFFIHKLHRALCRKPGQAAAAFA